VVSVINAVVPHTRRLAIDHTWNTAHSFPLLLLGAAGASLTDSATEEAYGCYSTAAGEKKRGNLERSCLLPTLVYYLKRLLTLYCYDSTEVVRTYKYCIAY